MNFDPYIISLCENHEWIARRIDKVNALFGELKDFQQAELTRSLLDRFYFVDEDKRNELYLSMVDHISSLYDIDTVISSFTIDSHNDSSHMVLNQLKVLLYGAGITRFNHVTRLSDLQKKSKKTLKFPDANRLILVDEFCGSGQTIRSRISWIRNYRPQIEHIHFCLMVGMEHALSELKHDYPDIDFFFAKTLRKGICGEYTGDELVRNVITMLHIERNLSESVNQKLLEDYSFGYGKAQALIGFSNFGNIPNSVFPLFWWPKSANGTKRNTLFIRCEDGF